MSLKYDIYIQEHKENVTKAFNWLEENVLSEMYDEKDRLEFGRVICQHDDSKYNEEEYEAYDEYFYGNKSYKTVENFNLAWLHHIHNNPHHWQFWVLLNDDPKEGEKLIDMPDCYIIEMICDWWSFSWKKGDLNEISKWYDEHKDYMKLSVRTRDKVETLLVKIEVALKESDENEKTN